MDALPTGTVTFLFTDIEGSTQRWDRDPTAMREALRRHDEIVRAAIAAHDGRVFKATGDGFCAAFNTAGDALSAAADAQLTLAAEDWTAVGGLSVRVAIHTGIADERDGDYFGPALNRVSRLLDLARGGHTLLTATTAALARESLDASHTLLSRGRYRLEDLTEPEVLHELLFANEQAAMSPLLGLGSASHNLPEPLNSYIESQHSVHDVMAHVRSSRILTLCGAGGVGKTRTALEASRRMLGEWPDGIWFVQLASATDLAATIEAIASTLRVRDIARRSIAETVLEYLAARQVLLVLDNCEQVVEEVASFLNKIVLHCRNVHALVTSREPLRITGERVFTIDPLPVPAFHPGRLPSLTELEASPAVKLFLERAHSVAPNFRFVETDRVAVLQICSRLDGIPLALELAAARMAAFAPSMLAERLENRFTLLTRGNRASLAHHRTLYALVDWSWGLLTENERILFRRLAVFADSWTLEAAESVCAGNGLQADAVLDLLESLSAKSLVRNDSGEVMRFRFLETIRAFASEKLDEARERELMESAHAMYFARLASEAEPYLRGASQGSYIAQIQLDVDNFRAALDAAERSANLRDAALSLCAGLSRFWLHTGAFSEGWRRLEPHGRRSDGDPNTLVRVMCGASLLALNEYNLDDFVNQAQRAVNISAKADDPWSIAFAAVCESSALSIVPGARTGRDETRVYGRARRLSAEVADPWLLSFVEFSEARRAAEKGDAQAAISAANASVTQARASGDRFLIYAVALYLANLLEFNDTARASALVLESVAALAAGNVAGLAACLECVVRLAVHQSRFVEAAELMGAAARYREAAAVPAWRCDPDEFRTRLIANLGNAAFDSAYSVGHSLSFTEATAAVENFVKAH